MKKEFIEFLNKLMDENSELTEQLMTDGIKTYIDILMSEKPEKPILTENGKKVLEFLQNNDTQKMWKARDIAEELFINSRSVSGTLRKLVGDGFCEKVAEDPAIYIITEKGKNFSIN